MEGKVGVGETLRETFAIYRDQAGVLLPVAFWLFLGVAILEALFGETIASFGTTMLTLVLTFLYQGMVVSLVRDLRDGRRDHHVRELVSSVTPVLWPLIGVGFITVLGFVFGLVLLIVPGLYLLSIWAVTAPVVMVERKGVFDALGRSRQLVRGNGWPVLGTVLIAFLIGTLIAVGLWVLSDALSDDPILEVVFYALRATVAAPIETLVASVLYFRLLEIKREDSVLKQPGDSPG